MVCAIAWLPFSWTTPPTHQSAKRYKCVHRSDANTSSQSFALAECVCAASVMSHLRAIVAEMRCKEQSRIARAQKKLESQCERRRDEAYRVSGVLWVAGGWTVGYTGIPGSVIFIAVGCALCGCTLDDRRNLIEKRCLRFDWMLGIYLTNKMCSLYAIWLKTQLKTAWFSCSSL